VHVSYELLDRIGIPARFHLIVDFVDQIDHLLMLKVDRFHADSELRFPGK
jgi:hypothetical protein